MFNVRSILCVSQPSTTLLLYGSFCMDSFSLLLNSLASSSTYHHSIDSTLPGPTNPAGVVDDLDTSATATAVHIDILMTSLFEQLIAPLITNPLSLDPSFWNVSLTALGHTHIPWINIFLLHDAPLALLMSSAGSCASLPLAPLNLCHQAISLFS